MSLLNKLLSWDMIVFNVIVLILFILIVRYLIRKNVKQYEEYNKKIVKQDRNEVVDVLIDSFSQPIILLSKKGKILKYNDSFYNLIAKQKVDDFLEEAYYIQEFIDSNLTYQRREIVVDSRTYYIDITKIAHDKFRRFIMSYTDISDIKDVYNKQEIFINDVKHELRTPVTAIMGLSDLLVENRIEEKVDQDKIIKTINSEAHRIAVLVNSLTTTISSSVKIKPSSIDELFDELRLIYASPDLNIELTFTNYIDELVEIDPRILKQILINLIDNALKFTKEGYVRVTAYPSTNNYRFAVVDTGIGIAEEELSYIYERFYRGDKSRNSAQGGYGLGLNIVLSLLDKINASIKVDSIENEGTTFTINIPKKDGE